MLPGLLTVSDNLLYSDGTRWTNKLFVKKQILLLKPEMIVHMSAHFFIYTYNLWALEI